MKKMRNPNIINNLNTLKGKFLKELKAFNIITPLLLLICVGCSDDIDVTGGIDKVPYGYLQLNIAVPDPIKVSTRSVDESAVNNIHVFIFNSDGSKLLQDKYVDELTGNSVNMSLVGEAREKAIQVCAVVNHKIAITEDLTVDKLKEMLLDGEFESYKMKFESGLPMFGNVAVNTSASSTASVPVYRLSAKISAFTAVENVKITEFRTYKYAKNAYLGSHHNEEDNTNVFGNSVAEEGDYIISESINSGNGNQTVLTYVFPSEGESELGKADGAYIVLKVEKEGKNPQYYRIDPRITVKEEDEETEEVKEVVQPVDFLANHHYVIEITGFMSDGYPDYEEAAKHPESDHFLVYKIHDHSEEVLSMITDGVHEFGISPEIALTSANPHGTIVVKCYDASKPTDPIRDTDVEIIEKSPWLEVSYSGPHNDNDVYDKDWDPDSRGTQLEYAIGIAGNVYEDTEGYITFQWLNLTRRVKVTYEAAYLLPTVCTAKLTIIDNDGTNHGDVIEDYWTFIQGKGTRKTESGSETPKLWGAQMDDMNGAKKRINGFHFPMPYGETNQWEYKYEIDFSKLAHDIEDTGSVIDDIKMTVTNDPDEFWADHIKWDYSSGTKGTLTFTGDKTSYKYAGGSITFTVHFSDNNGSSDIVASVYHTGFFHYEGREEDYTSKDQSRYPNRHFQYVDEDDKGYYYYEVIQMGNEGDYWLDRNIGAKNNKPFIDYETDDLDRSGAGRLYSIINEPQKYKLPIWDGNICPPGYHVPNEVEWDHLRLHKNFTTESVIYNNSVYMSTFYDTQNSKIGRIYFPKARFFNQDEIWTETTRYSMEPNTGDTGAAYYWTVTEAPAMEKEEMGNWVRALYLNGTASSYVNASITDHRMPVRCKAGTPEQASTAKDYYISFNVHNVTHVYLFDKKSKTALFTFPGRAVGSTKSAIKWQNFYCSTTANPIDLLVLFVKLEEDGRVLVHTKNGPKFYSTVNYTEDFLSPDYAWEVKNGWYYDFCDVSLDREGKDCLFQAKENPSDCITTSEDENQGGDGGSGSEQPEEDINPNDYTFEPEKEDEIVISYDKAFLKGWSKYESLSNGKYNWSQIITGSTLKIYVVTGSGFNLQGYHGNWGSSLFDISEIDHQSSKNTDISVIEIELNKDILNALVSNKGLIIQGNKCAIIGITVIMANPENVPVENFVWSGSWDNSGWSNPFTQLSTTNFNWEGVKPGHKLTVVFDSSGGPQLQFHLISNDGSIPGISDYTPWNDKLLNQSTYTDYKIEILFDATMISAIKAGGGLKIGGGAYTLKKVELIVLP